MKASITKGFEYLDKLGWQEGEAVWYEILAFKLKVDFQKKPSA